MKKLYLFMVFMLWAASAMADTSTYTATATATATKTALRTNTYTLTSSLTATYTNGPSQTNTATATATATSTITVTPSLTPNTYIATGDMQDVTVVDAAANGVTDTALGATWTLGQYRIMGCDPVSSNWITAAPAYQPFSPNNGHFTKVVLAKNGYVEIRVINSETGNAVNLSKTGRAITFHLTVIRQNYDYWH